MEANTIINTPENIMIVTHKVSDFAKWKASYDEHDSMRSVHGIRSYVIGRGVEDPNMVMVVVKADDMAKAKAFARDPSLKKAMQKGGVTGTPSISLNTTIWQDTAVLGPDIIRSRTTFTVKDWDSWQKSFADGKQERLDNGISDRVYGYDPDDNKKVSLVVAITDSAKASAYWNSDALKKRREAGGVISEPKRFLFRVVQRY
jgi:heme-degrading monooxygenase HmoA